MTDEENIDELAEELTQKYFQRFGTFTCSWENVKEILKERIEIEQSLKEQNKIILEDNDTLNKWIDELKAHCKAVDDVNAKMKCCRKADISGMGSYPYNCEEWELAE